MLLSSRPGCCFGRICGWMGCVGGQQQQARQSAMLRDLTLTGLQLPGRRGQYTVHGWPGATRRQHSAPKKLTQCIRAQHRAAAALLHRGEQTRHAACRVGPKRDHAQLPRAARPKVFGNLWQPRADEDEVVGVVRCADHAEADAACRTLAMVAGSGCRWVCGTGQAGATGRGGGEGQEQVPTPAIQMLDGAQLRQLLALP